MAEFLTKKQLKTLDSHSYHSEGKSYLERTFLCKLWDLTINYIPQRWAPNSMTLAGVVFMVVPFVMFVLADPDGKTEKIAPFYYYAMAFGLFMFQQLDNLDGRQAKRTNSCNALGEFFDHGCDTISDGCMTLAIIMTLKAGQWPNLFFLMGLLAIPDYCFYWRAHWSGKYVFGDLDISEIQWIIITILTTTGLTGQSIWEVEIFGFFQIRTFLILFYFGFCAYYLGDVWVDAVKIGLFHHGDVDDETRRRVLAPVNPIIINILLALIARFYSDGIYDKFPVAFLVIYVLIEAKLSCRLLIANMTKTRMITWDSSMLAFVFLLLSNKTMVPAAIQLSPSAALFVALTFAVVDFVKYSIAICSQLADHLNIYCLSLNKPPSPKNN